jgi:hypothetical protein
MEHGLFEPSEARVVIESISALGSTPGGGDDERWEVLLREGDRSETQQFRTARREWHDAADVLEALQLIIRGLDSYAPALPQISERVGNRTLDHWLIPE